MYDRRERNSSTRWIAWMPLLFVGAFLYWSVALGLGGLSLMAANALSSDLLPAPDLASTSAPTAMEPVPGHLLGESVVVHLEESAEPEDVNDNVGAAAPADAVDQGDSQIDNNDGTGRLSGQGRN
jgi:hypothetical protein